MRRFDPDMFARNQNKAAVVLAGMIAVGTNKAEANAPSRNDLLSKTVPALGSTFGQGGAATFAAEDFAVGPLTALESRLRDGLVANGRLIRPAMQSDGEWRACSSRIARTLHLIFCADPALRRAFESAPLAAIEPTWRTAPQLSLPGDTPETQGGFFSTTRVRQVDGLPAVSVVVLKEVERASEAKLIAALFAHLQMIYLERSPEGNPRLSPQMTAAEAVLQIRRSHNAVSALVSAKFGWMCRTVAGLQSEEELFPASTGSSLLGRRELNADLDEAQQVVEKMMRLRNLRFDQISDAELEAVLPPQIRRQPKNPLKSDSQP